MLTKSIPCNPSAIHTHNYDMRGLIGRGRAEGFGWQLLGETYGLFEMLRDMCRFRVYRELLRGILKRRVRSSAELLFPAVEMWQLADVGRR